MITVYSTEFCTWCKRTKAYLASLHVDFADVDVGNDDEKAQEMIEKSGQMAVPVIDIEGDIIVGYDKQAIDASLKKHRLGIN